MKKFISFFALLAAVALLSGHARAHAGDTGSGTLTVTGTIARSISMVFNSDASSVALTGTGTNALPLPSGTVAMSK